MLYFVNMAVIHVSDEVMQLPCCLAKYDRAVRLNKKPPNRVEIYALSFVEFTRDSPIIPKVPINQDEKCSVN
jgi:hypothetical protein